MWAVITSASVIGANFVPLMCTVRAIPIRGRTEEARDAVDEWRAGRHVSSEGEERAEDLVGRARRLWQEDYTRGSFIIDGSVAGGCGNNARGVSVVEDDDDNRAKGKLSIFRNTLLSTLMCALSGRSA